MNIKFQDRFNRVWYTTTTVKLFNISYNQQLSIPNRSKLPARFWLSGGIVWRDPYKAAHCTTGPAISRINGETEYYLKDKKVTAFEVIIL